MSLEDIKDSFSIIKINGKEYKICYKHKQIADVQKLFEQSSPLPEISVENCKQLLTAPQYKDVISICAMLMNNEPVSIVERINFCLIGFKKHHPEISLDIIDDVDNYYELFDLCRNEFLSRNMQPEIYKQLAIADEKVKKKIKKQNQSLVGRIVSILQSMLAIQK